MKTEDIAKQLADQVKAALAARDKTIAELVDRVKTLEARPEPKDGRDGVDGKDGEKGDPGDATAAIEQVAELASRVKSLEERPAPRDGRDGIQGQKGDTGERGYDGRDGSDGWSPDHVEFVMQPDGTGEFRMITGEKEKSFPFRLPVLVDTGPYKQEASYMKGQGVTYGGDYWICKEDNPGPPGKDFAGWRLAVRKGRDARGAKV
jgi:hypothetical protein